MGSITDRFSPFALRQRRRARANGCPGAPDLPRPLAGPDGQPAAVSGPIAMPVNAPPSLGPPATGIDSAAAPPPFMPRIEISVRRPDPDREARDALISHGRFLARQDAWDTLAQVIRQADADRALTPGGVPQATLLAQGARSDAIATLPGRIREGDRRAERPVLAMFDAQREEDPDCPALAYVLASAHIEIAEMWRAGQPLNRLSEVAQAACRRNLTEAGALVDRFDPFEQDSALWAMVRCAAIEAAPDAAARVQDAFDDLIDLDPGCPTHFMTLGRMLVPERLGSAEALTAAALRLSQSTADRWGQGAYALVLIGALEGVSDPNAQLVQALDPARFDAALRDVLRHAPSQHMVNRLAAFVGVTLPSARSPTEATAPLAHALDWIAREHLRELHPEVWARAPLPPQARPLLARIEDPADGAAQIGRNRAHVILAEAFATELSRDGRLVFGPEGLLLG